MKYRDNDVYLSLEPYSLIEGTYTIDNFSITSGQDPKEFIKKGMTFSCDKNGKMTFKVGRKGSESVAKWFNSNVHCSRTTFNHPAVELNFAFLGTLKLTITGGVLIGRQKTITFKNIALAQGHSGASNNWWFGGQNCTHFPDNQVYCKEKDSTGYEVLFAFLRGGNDVNTIKVSPVDFVNTEKWMELIDDKKRLSEIVIPGSHDSGMSELHHCAPLLLAEGYTKTQSDSVGQQLLDGCRYFDIRVDYDYDNLVTYHREDQWGCNGQNLKDVLEQTKNFLYGHPTETAILNFSHIRKYENHDPVATKKKINDLLDNYASVIYTNQSTNVNLADVLLGDVRGKMILIFEYNEYIEPGKGRFRFMNGTWPQSGAHIAIYDRYSNTSDYEKMKADQLSKWKTKGGLGKGYFFLLSWTLTSNIGDDSISLLATKANRNLYDVLYDQIKALSTKPNIVYIDFFYNALSQSIILYNFN